MTGWGWARQGLPVKFWLAFFNPAGNIVDSPILCYAGRMDQPIQGTDTSTISIAVENRLADLQRRIEAAPSRQWLNTERCSPQ